MHFDELKESVSNYPELQSPSFLQGMLIGLLCVDNDIQLANWVKKLMQEADAKSIKESFLKGLQNLYLETNKGLNGSGFELKLCLPDDSAPVNYRLQMVADLCEGAMYGIGLAGGLNEMEHELSEDVRDVINSLSEIARVDVSMDLSKEDEESVENDLEEIIEFIKVSVLLLNEELNPSKAAPIMNEGDLDATVH